MADWDRFDKALFRCLNETEIVKAQRTAHIVLRQVLPESAKIDSGFPGLVNAALNFATQGALSLILEKHKTKGRSGFWWLHYTALTEVSGYKPEPTDIAFLKCFSSRIKILRDKTLFHITEDSLQNPSKLRAERGPTYANLDKAISLTLPILRDMLSLRRSSTTWTKGTDDVSTLDYDESDIKQIFRTN